MISNVSALGLFLKRYITDSTRGEYDLSIAIPRALVLSIYVNTVFIH